MSTFCHGIASAQALDKSAEIVDIKGLDITSLPISGILNYEHRSEIPGQICGKILTAKKIFDKADCDGENELYFWNRCKVPFVYITAELLDDYCQSGKDAAGILRYDHDKKDQNKQAILGFSVEGSEIPNTRKGQLITRSIARKVTLTAAPCNSLCVAELLENSPKPQVKDDFDFIFKSQEDAITLFKSGEGEKIYTDFLYKKEAEGPSQGGKPPKSPSTEYEGQGIRTGTTKSGKHIHSHGHTGSYGFNPAEHQHTGEFHNSPRVIAQNPKLSTNKEARLSTHSNALASGGRAENRAALSLNDKNKIAQEQSKQQMAKNEKVCELHKEDKLNKPVFSHTKGKDLRAGLPGLKSGAGTSYMGAHVRNKKDFTAEGKKHSMGRAKEIAGKELKRLQNAPKPDLGKSEKSWTKMTGTDPHIHSWKHSNGKDIISLDTKQKKIFHNGANAKQYMDDQHALRLLNAHMNEIGKPSKELKKALEAGSYNSAPSTLTNGAAYQTEGLANKKVATGAEDHNFQGTKKKDWKKRANEDYDKWPLKDKFEKYMAQRMPHLHAGEIRAIGKVISLNKSEESPKLGNHFLFSAENPMHPHKNELKMDHKQTLAHLKEKGFNAHEVKGHYGSPETSIMVHDVSPEQAEHLHGIASKLGQDSSIYSNGGKHEMRFHHGENAGKKVHGEGTVWHKEKPKDMYTTMSNGQHFTHNFDFGKSLAKSELDEKTLKDIQEETAVKWADRAEEAYKKAIDQKSVKWLMDAIEYGHEAIEHSSLGEELSVFEKIRAKLMPIHKEAIKLFVSEEKS